jgi:hypothetical protein
MWICVRGLPQALQADARNVPRLVHGRFLPDFFTIHESSCHAATCSSDTDSTKETHAGRSTLKKECHSDQEVNICSCNKNERTGNEDSSRVQELHRSTCTSPYRTYWPRSSPVNCCRSSPAQSFLVSGPMTKFFFLLRAYICLETGPPVRGEDCLRCPLLGPR